MANDGQCGFCKESISKRESRQHFISCKARQHHFEHLRQKTANDWFYLRAEQPPYWIDVLIPSKWLLSDLDQLLRDTWLECCDHLSHFCIGDVVYERFQDEDWLAIDEELSPSMEVPLHSVISKGIQFSHVYDYGTSTELKLRVYDWFCFSLRKGVFLCSRNTPPLFKCSDCEEPASRICSYCSDYICATCAPTHLCVLSESSDHMLVGLVNSPRTGLCGYDGTEPGQ